MKTRDDIVNDIIKETVTAVPEIKNYRSGGVFYTFIQVVASFLEKIYLELEQLLPNRFLMTAKDKWLDMKAEELSLKRYPATKTRGYVIFSRSDTEKVTKVTKDKIVGTKGGLRYKVVADVELKENESARSILVEAEEVGSKYNVVGGLVTDIITPISGIDRVLNPNDWVTKMGKDEETDESLRSRCLSLWQGLSGANKGAYIAWTKSVEGFGDVRIVSTARGLGTVDVIFVGIDNMQPNQELIERVQNVINDKKPIATDILVKAPSLVPIDMVINVVLLPSSSLTKDEIKSAVQMYFKKIKIGEDFEPSALSGFLFGNCEGIKSIVLDNQPIVISELQIASLGRLNINISNSEHT